MERADAARLVTAAAAGDEAAWQALVTEFSGLVWSIARGYRLGHADAADVFQTTWLRLAEHIGRIENAGSVGAWLATAARRECLQAIRGAARTVLVEDIARLDAAAAPGGSPTEESVLQAEHEKEQAEQAEAAWQALGRLPGRCHELLRTLLATPPPSYAEVAAALGLPVGSIGPTRARCLQKLREELAGGISGRVAPS